MGDSLVTFNVGDRRSGKSTKILEWLKEVGSDGVVICMNHVQALLLFERAEKEGLDVAQHQFISLYQAQRGDLKGRNCRVAIDEGQYILEQLAEFQLELVTATGKVD